MVNVTPLQLKYTLLDAVDTMYPISTNLKQVECAIFFQFFFAKCILFVLNANTDCKNLVCGIFPPFAVLPW